MVFPQYPQDPRFGIPLTLSNIHVAPLCNGKMLSQNVIDYLIQRAAPIPDGEIEGVGYVVCGGTGAMMSMISLNESYTDNDVKVIERGRKEMKDFRNGKYTVVVPHIKEPHYFVVSITVRSDNPVIYEAVHVYDSMVVPSKDAGNLSHAEALAFLQVFNEYWHNFVLCDDGNETREMRESVLYGLGTIKLTPQQHGGLDCGLFVVGVVLHLLEGIPVNTSSFDRHMVSGLRTSLSVEIKKYKESETPLKIR